MENKSDRALDDPEVIRYINNSVTKNMTSILKAIDSALGENKDYRDLIYSKREDRVIPEPRTERMVAIAHELLSIGEFTHEEVFRFLKMSHSTYYTHCLQVTGKEPIRGKTKHGTQG